MKSFSKALIFLFFCFIANNLIAQEAVTTSGDEAIGSGGSVSYTVGQVAYTSIKNANNSINQGVQQPYEISVISGVKTGNGIRLEASAYPNPTTDFLKLHIKDYFKYKLSCYLYDDQGKLIRTKEVTEQLTTIPFQNLVPAIYLIKIAGSGTEIQTFKIIKR